MLIFTITHLQSGQLNLLGIFLNLRISKTPISSWHSPLVQWIFDKGLLSAIHVAAATVLHACGVLPQGQTIPFVHRDLSSCRKCEAHVPFDCPCWDVPRKAHESYKHKKRFQSGFSTQGNTQRKTTMTATATTTTTFKHPGWIPVVVGLAGTWKIVSGLEMEKGEMRWDKQAAVI